MCLKKRSKKETAQVKRTKKWLKKRVRRRARKASTKKDREDERYIKWRTSIFKRDKTQCQRCRKKNCYVNAHHIRPWATFPDDRYDIKNGVTLCVKCHWKVHHCKSSKFLDLGFGRNYPVPKKRTPKRQRGSKNGYNRQDRS